MSVAQRRKQRRLRSWWRHEQQSIGAALATSLHHSSRGLRKARAGEEESETKYTAKFRTTPPPQPVLFSLYDEEPSGRRPASLAEPPRPQERVPRHTVEQMADVAPMVQILDAPVPQTVDKLHDVLQFFDRLSAVPEPVIEVPKIYTDDVPMSAVFRATQLAEQLVEVPTIISFSVVALLHALLEQRIVGQNVDIPAVGGSGTGGGLSGFLPTQNYSMTAEQIVDNPVPRPGGAGDLQGFPRGPGPTAFSEQVLEFPDPGGGRQDFQPVQGSAASSSDSPGQAGQWVFLALFPGRKKCKDPAHPGVGTGCRVELMDAVSLAGVSSVAQHGVRLLLLVAERQEWCFLVCSSGLPSYPVAWSKCWCRLCLATSPSWRLLEEFPLLRAFRRAIRTWKSGLCVLRCLGVASGVRRIRDACFAWFNSGCMFYERLLANFTHFLRAVNSDPRCSLSIPQNGEVCTVDASSCSVSSRGSHFESGHYFYELSMMAVLG